MKKLIFIDNDDKKRAEEDMVYVLTTLDTRFKLSGEIVDKMKIIPDFSRVDRDEAYKLLFDKNNVIVTWSMYTVTHANSLGQFAKFISAAGRNDIKNMVYLDTSGRLTDGALRDINTTLSARSET